MPAMCGDDKPGGAEHWVRHLRERPKDKPFFCWFASHDAQMRMMLAVRFLRDPGVCLSPRSLSHAIGRR